MNYQLIKHYNTGLGAERVSTLTLDTVYPYNIGQERVIYSIALEDIEEGDLLVFRGQFVITCDEAFQTRSVIMAKLCDSASAVTGIDIAAGYTVNMDDGLHHHFPFFIANNWTAPQAFSGKFLNIVAFAAATSAGNVKVEQGYGHLSAEHFRDLDRPPVPSIGDPQSSYMIATGGDVTILGDYKIHVFDGAGDLVISDKGETGLVEILLVGGGGGGANSGGGAGEYVSRVVELEVGTYPAVIGGKGLGGLSGPTGGADATAGGDSVFDGLTAKGGAPGVRGGIGAVGLPGGSGSGSGASSSANLAAGASTAEDGKGNAGGRNNILTSPYPSGGGGGASEAGKSGASQTSGAGGKGLSNDITGTSVSYCDGGAGSNFAAGGTSSLGGNGSGGAGRTTGGTGNSAIDGTGSGGGGTINGYVGGNGGDGILVVKYRFQ